jgi:4-hydroxybenzoate polyprenyltransferase
MISQYFKLVKFSHSIFALPFAMIGFFLAVKTRHLGFSPDSLFLLLYVVLCMIFARNSAMGFNRWLDRNIDKKNPRTTEREIPSGKIHQNSALIFVIINSLAFVSVTFFINRLVFILSPIALVVILGYSYTKRFTWLCHLILGLGLSLAPIGAYLSVTGKFAVLPVIFSFAVLFWTAGFDIIYALQDEEFDKNENLKSIPVKIGKRAALLLSGILHTITATLIVLAGFWATEIFEIFYWLGVALFIISLIYQHLIVKPDDLSRVNLAFATTNGFAGLSFAIFTIVSIFVK